MAEIGVRVYPRSMTNLSDNLRGALLMVMAMSAFTVNDACIKSLTGEVAVFQSIFIRGIMASLMVLVIARWIGVIGLGFGAADWRRLGLRAFAEAGAAFCFISALFNMPLANVSAILQSLPLTVTLAAAVFLSEPVGWRRWVAIGVGFLGVLLIIRPGTDGFSVYSLYAMGAVGCATLRDLATRSLSPAVTNATATLFTALAVTFVAGLLSAGEVWQPLTGRVLGILFVASGFLVMAYVGITMAMRVGEISFVAPFRYSSLIVALVLGGLVFGDWPDGVTYLGAVIVVGSGLFAFYREQVVARKALRAG
jgi:S-adenosylmethionine uptake transporter